MVALVVRTVRAEVPIPPDTKVMASGFAETAGLEEVREIVRTTVPEKLLRPVSDAVEEPE